MERGGWEQPLRKAGGRDLHSRLSPCLFTVSLPLTILNMSACMHACVCVCACVYVHEYVGLVSTSLPHYLWACFFGSLHVCFSDSGCSYQEG